MFYPQDTSLKESNAVEFQVWENDCCEFTYYMFETSKLV